MDDPQKNDIVKDLFYIVEFPEQPSVEFSSHLGKVNKETIAELEYKHPKDCKLHRYKSLAELKKAKKEFEEDGKEFLIAQDISLFLY